MRKLFSLIALLVMLSLPAISFAASTTATFGDQNSSNAYRVIADTDGTVTYQSDTGIMYPYVNYSTYPTTVGVTLTAAQSGTTITDTGGGTTRLAGSCRKFTLPTAVAGMSFSFAAGAFQCTMTVDVQSTDTIQYSISSVGLDAGDSIKSTGQAGDSVTLFSTAANLWQVKSMKAVWTDNSTN